MYELISIKDYNYSVSDFTLDLPTVSQKEILNAYKLAHRKYYLRMSLMLRQLKDIDSLTMLVQKLKGFLAILLGVDD